MTEKYLQELCGKTEVTHEMLMKLLNERDYFEALFTRKAAKDDESTVCSTSDALPNILGR